MRHRHTASSLSIFQTPTLAISTFLCITAASSSCWRHSRFLLSIIFLSDRMWLSSARRHPGLLSTGWWEVLPPGRGGQKPLGVLIYGVLSSQAEFSEFPGNFCWGFLLFPAACQPMALPPRPSPTDFWGSLQGHLSLQCLLKQRLFPSQTKSGHLQLFSSVGKTWSPCGSGVVQY